MFITKLSPDSEMSKCKTNLTKLLPIVTASIPFCFKKSINWLALIISGFSLKIIILVSTEYMFSTKWQVLKQASNFFAFKWSTVILSILFCMAK